jgi:hypothetical protein
MTPTVYTPNLYIGIYHANIDAEVENDQRENVIKLPQAHGASARTVYSTLHKDLQLSKSQIGRGNQTALQGDKEGAIENVQGDHSDDLRGFLTILDNLLTVGMSAGEGGGGQAVWSQPH